jgi:Family of unknown function (DUF5832)
MVKKTNERTMERDPSDFVFNDEESEIIKQHVNERMEEICNKEENLKRDVVTVPNQNYAIISIISSVDKMKNCVKIRGVFETVDEAKRHASRISAADSMHNLLIVSMYDWLLIPPDYERINDQHYIDEELNNLISDYKRIQEKSKIEFDIRKESLKKNTHTIVS